MENMDDMRSNFDVFSLLPDFRCGNLGRLGPLVEVLQ